MKKIENFELTAFRIGQNFKMFLTLEFFADSCRQNRRYFWQALEILSLLITNSFLAHSGANFGFPKTGNLGLKINFWVDITWSENSCFTNKCFFLSGKWFLARKKTTKRGSFLAIFPPFTPYIWCVRKIGCALTKPDQLKFDLIIIIHFWQKISRTGLSISLPNRNGNGRAVIFFPDFITEHFVTARKR